MQLGATNFIQSALTLLPHAHSCFRKYSSQ